MSQPNTGPNNWQAAENKLGITAPKGNFNSETNTGSKHYAKLNNDYGTKSATQGVQIGGGQPSSTKTGPAQTENKVASSTAASGLNGGGRVFGGGGVSMPR